MERLFPCPGGVLRSLPIKLLDPLKELAQGLATMWEQERKLKSTQEF